MTRQCWNSWFERGTVPVHVHPFEGHIKFQRNFYSSTTFLLNSKMKATFEPSSSTEDRFTVKLHKLLEDAEKHRFQDIIGWNPDRRSFTIFKPVEFADTVMGKYFRQSKYKSFQRQMNLYGFHRGSRNGIRGVCELRRNLWCSFLFSFLFDLDDLTISARFAHCRL